MEETLGKRISAHRKRLGLTQDALAERLGVTAQAVSKWENDQSCPDITTLPKLAEVFSCSTDELLGLQPKAVHVAEAVTTAREDDSKEPEELHAEGGTWEFQWDGGRKSSLGFGIWLLVAGGLASASAVFGWGVDIWHILWSSGLMVFGFWGLLRKFTVMRLGVTVFGGYFLLWHLGVLPRSLMILKWELVIPGTLLLLGLCLLMDGFRRPKSGTIHMKHNGKTIGKTSTHCTCEDEAFRCATSFGSNRHMIQLPRLSEGLASVSFGELVVDLRGCQEVTNGCQLELTSAFGALELLIPRFCRAEPNIRTAFAALEIEGSPAADADTVICLNGSASFGTITIRYV